MSDEGVDGAGLSEERRSSWVPEAEGPPLEKVEEQGEEEVVLEEFEQKDGSARRIPEYSCGRKVFPLPIAVSASSSTLLASDR